MPFPAKMLQGLDCWLLEIGTCILEEELVCAFPLWFNFLVLNFLLLRKILIEVVHQSCWLGSELSSGISKF